MEEKSNSDIVELYKRYRILFLWNDNSWRNIIEILYKYKNWDLVSYGYKHYHDGIDEPNFEMIIWANEYPSEFLNKLDICKIYNIQKYEDIYED